MKAAYQLWSSHVCGKHSNIKKNLFFIIEKQQLPQTKCFSFLCLLDLFSDVLSIICMKFISALLLLRKEKIVKLILFVQVQKLSNFSTYLPSCNLWCIAIVLYMHV